MKTRALVAAAAAAAAMAVVPAASAHVTLNPREWEADGFARFAIRVPNERDDAETTTITVKFPREVISASFQPVEGWRRQVKMAKLSKPLEIDGERITEKIDTVSWSGGRIRPGEFQEFGVSFRTPSEPGTTLSFPALQRYSSGEVVRWIGPADADEPAPIVEITEPVADGGNAAATPAPVSGAAEGEGGSDTLSVIALVVGTAGLITAIASLLWRRRLPAPADPQMHT